MVPVPEFIAVVDVPSLRMPRARRELEATYRASARGAILLLLGDASPEACDRLLDAVVPTCKGPLRGIRYATRVPAPAGASPRRRADETDETGSPLPVDAALLAQLREAGVPWVRLQDAPDAFRIDR